jgi:hypothetical protein
MRKILNIIQNRQRKFGRPVIVKIHTILFNLTFPFPSVGPTPQLIRENFKKIGCDGRKITKYIREINILIIKENYIMLRGKRLAMESEIINGLEDLVEVK